MGITGRPPSIHELIDQRSLSRFQIVTILLCGLVLVLDGLASQSIGFLAPSMAQTLHLPLPLFGAVFSSALLGLMLSSMLAGPIADRLGRKGPIVLATITFGVFTIATARAGTLKELIALRFLTGLGLGAAIPNAVALVTEYAPKRLQHILVTALFCGMPLGALLGGVFGSIALPRWGWRPVFYIGGLMPLVLSVVLIVVLPESLHFLSVRGSRRQAIGKILDHLGLADKQLVPDLQAIKGSPQSSASPVLELFTDGRAAGTLLLWVPFFMNLLLLYFIVNWLPALLRQAQMPASAGAAAISLFSLGGVMGSLLQGFAMKGFGCRPVLFLEFASSVAVVWSLAFIESLPLMMATVFVAGCLVQGAQAGINATAATYYPTPMRSTGVGWALGVGRLGSVLGPVLGGLMMANAWNFHKILFASGLSAFAAAAAILLSACLPTGRSPYQPA